MSDQQPAAAFAHQVATRHDEWARQHANAAAAEQTAREDRILARHDTALRDASRALLANLARAQCPIDRQVARMLHRNWVARLHGDLEHALTGRPVQIQEALR